MPEKHRVVGLNLHQGGRANKEIYRIHGAGYQAGGGDLVPDIIDISHGIPANDQHRSKRGLWHKKQGRQEQDDNNAFE